MRPHGPATVPAALASALALALAGCGRDALTERSRTAAPADARPDVAGPDAGDAPRGPDPARDAAAPADSADGAPDARPDVPGSASDVPGGASDVPGGAADRDAAPRPPPSAAEVVLNELECARPEWVEVVNLAADRPADLAGFTFARDERRAAGGYRFPAGAVLPPGGRLVVERAQDGEPGFDFGIPCGDGTAVLLAPDGSVADAAALAPHGAWATFGRLPDATGPFQPTAPTPGARNAAPVDPTAPLFDPQAVVELDLDFAPGAREALAAAPRTYVPATLRLTAGGETSGPIPVGLRLKGRLGSFRPLGGKAAFRVSFVFEGGAPYRSLKRLVLNNMVQDPTMLRETVFYRVLRAAGVPAPRTGFAFVRVDGVPYGLYLTLEPYDDPFLRRHFASTEHLYEAEYGEDLFPGAESYFEVDEGDPDDRADLAHIVETAHTTPAHAWVAALREVAHLDRLLALWAAELHLGHWDGYAADANNYYLHTDGAGRLTLLPGGADQTFAQPLPPFKGRGVLFRRCLTVPDCRAAYAQALAALVETIDGLALEPYVRDRAADLAPWIAADPRRPAPPPGVDAETIPAFLAGARERATEALACLADPDPPDADGDGFTCVLDCQDTDPTIHAGALDVCGDGIDQDCTGYADDGLDCDAACTERTRGGRRYLFCLTDRAWYEGRAHCRALGADLVVLDDVAEAAWVHAEAQALRAANYWVGATDSVAEGDFRLGNGQPVPAALWAPGEPSDSHFAEDCACLLADSGRLNDWYCTGRLPVVCEDLP
jgi:hypothetical protein